MGLTTCGNIFSSYAISACSNPTFHGTSSEHHMTVAISGRNSTSTIDSTFNQTASHAKIERSYSIVTGLIGINTTGNIGHFSAFNGYITLTSFSSISRVIRYI